MEEGLSVLVDNVLYSGSFIEKEIAGQNDIFYSLCDNQYKHR